MTEGRRESPSEAPSERIGPLLVEHHRKADGRALIRYREAPHDGEAPSDGEASDAGKVPDTGEAAAAGEASGDG